MGWVRKQLKTNMPSCSVDTFAGSFDDGTAFLGIIDSLCPGAVNLDDVDPNNAREVFEKDGAGLPGGVAGCLTLWC